MTRDKHIINVSIPAFTFECECGATGPTRSSWQVAQADYEFHKEAVCPTA